jgi:hypothetical protein
VSPTTLLPRLLARLPPRWRWTLHNLVGHPLSELLWQAGARELSNVVHDATVPAGGDRDPEARG